MSKKRTHAEKRSASIDQDMRAAMESKKTETITAGQVPNFRTINSFRLRHLEDLAELFTQIVYLCKELGMIGFKHLAIDGQKIKANANFKKSKNLAGLKSCWNVR